MTTGCVTRCPPNALRDACSVTVRDWPAASVALARPNRTRRCPARALAVTLMRIGWSAVFATVTFRPAPASLTFGVANPRASAGAAGVGTTGSDGLWGDGAAVVVVTVFVVVTVGPGTVVVTGGGGAGWGGGGRCREGQAVAGDQVRRIEHDRVARAAAVDLVGPGAAVEVVGAVAAGELVVAGVAADGVVAHVADEQVVAVAAGQRVVARTGVGHVLAGAAIEAVDLVAAREHVVAGARRDVELRAARSRWPR